MASATEALGRLRQACKQLPNPSLLITPALNREAVDTSALEGTYGALSDVLEARLPMSPPSSPEVVEISAYIEMARLAFDWIVDRPITIGMLSDLQSILAKGSRVPPRDPSRVRDHQVFIGPKDSAIQDARFVPSPPGDRLRAGLESWQSWISEHHDLPIPVRVALAHYQFETLHPFGDGNGRVGRLVAILQLICDGALHAPALTLSPWLLRKRSEYQDQMLRVSQTGNWDPWVQLFSTAIREQCEALVGVADRLLAWIARVRQQLAERRWGGVIQKLAEDLIDWPVITAPWVVDQYGISAPSAKHAIDRLVQIEVLRPMSKKKYRRAYGATDVIAIVESF